MSDPDNGQGPMPEGPTEDVPDYPLDPGNGSKD